jgi:predicted nucleotidyltransferase
VLKKRCSFIVMEKSRKEILAKIKQAVKRIEPKAKIILFGSRARGDERTDSDWDLLILIPGKADLKKEQEFRHALFLLELEYGQAFSTFVYSNQDWEKTYRITPLYQNIQKEGVRL